MILGPNISLIIHNVASIVSAITSIGLVLFLFINGKRNTANIAFALMFVAAIVFIISHVIGVNISDPELSRNILFFNLAVFPIGFFVLHATLALINKDKENRILLIVTYVVGIVSMVFFLIFPETFLLPSVSKMYFPNYYEPGIFNLWRVIFLQGLIIPYSVYKIYQAYKETSIPSEKNQFKYFMYTMVIGFGLSFLPNLLVYGIPFDPLYGMAFAIPCAIPLIYGAIKYELFNVKIIAVQAFLYTIAVVSIGGIISLLNYLNIWLADFYPNFPSWTTALVSAVLAVTVSVFVWRHLRQNDILKYEFITTVTHKFRTPLTYIKWATENLSGAHMTDSERINHANNIKSANEKLIELTTILANVSEAESKTYDYKIEKRDLNVVVEEIIDALSTQLKSKNLNIVKNLDKDGFALFDLSRMKFVLQVLIENALHYTPQGGTIVIESKQEKSNCTLSVHDSGIGMTKEQIDLLFSKFYRGSEARKADTEGMGIGLYISKQIMEKHRGKIWAVSEGTGKGSTFFISLPRA